MSLAKSNRAKLRTVRTLWRVYTHRKAGHVLIVDPGAVTCSTCVRAKGSVRHSQDEAGAA